MPNNKRLLFFDVLRVTAVSFIVLRHISTAIIDFYPFNLMLGFRHIYYVSMGGLGVSILLFVSGAVLEYQKKTINDYKSLLYFYEKRFWRIYPAYWLTMIPGTAFLILFNYEWSIFDLLMQYSGFNAFIGHWGGSINAVGWFIGMIMILYILYPLLSKLSSKNPLLFLFSTFIISRIFYFLFSYYDIGNSGERWFPLCNLFEFGLGIIIIQTGFYIKSVYSWKPLMIASDLSFYVFLVHVPTLYLARDNVFMYILTTICIAITLWRIDIFIKPLITPAIPSILKRFSGGEQKGIR